MTIWLWVGFIVVVMGMLALDLGVLNRKTHAISTREAAVWTALWVTVALIFNVAVYYLYENHVFGIGLEVGHPTGGNKAAIDFLTGYLVEKSLSLDNIFVIALIFQYFHVPLIYQHRVLFWGIIGALVLRGAMILAGTALIRQFSWIIYVFGGLLILSAIKMLLMKNEKLEPDRNPLVRLARRIYPVSSDYHGERFFTRINGQRAITPLMLVLLVVESSDVMFAVDSIPAIFAITLDPFIVFTSNVFAILGLRSLYFVLASVIDKFKYLKLSLVILLVYIGIKMILAHHYPIPAGLSLAVVCLLLGGGIVASVLVARREDSLAPMISPEEQGESALTDYLQIRGAALALFCASLVLIGLTLLILPWPQHVVIPAGLTILAVEYFWFRGMLNKMKKNIPEHACAKGGSPK